MDIYCIMMYLLSFNTTKHSHELQGYSEPQEFWDYEYNFDGVFENYYNDELYDANESYDELWDANESYDELWDADESEPEWSSYIEVTDSYDDANESER